MEDQRRLQLTNRRAALTASLWRADQFVTKYQAERDQTQVQLRIENLSRVWKELEEVMSELEEAETTDTGREQNNQARYKSESTYFKVMAALQSFLPANLNAFPNASHAPIMTGLSGIKLPTISLPEFDGDYNQWLAFHDTFAALIHSNNEVPDVQKFHYLRAAVKGEAAQLIESISISSANYSIAWQTLTSRYANDYLLKKRHLQALLDCPRMKRESAEALHSLVDEFERHTNILRQLKEPIEQWSTILEHLLCIRLDDGTLKAWEDHATTVDDPNYACLVEFLHRRIRVLESMSVNHQSQNSQTHMNHYPPTRKPFQHRVATHTVAVDHLPNCYACNQRHFLIKCPRFDKMSIPDRLRLVESNRLCQNCFRHDHFARNCNSTYSCRYCQRRHHTMLHISNHNEATNHRFTNQVPLNSKSISNRNNAPNTSTSYTCTNSINNQHPDNPVSPSNSNVMLPTIVLLVVDSNGNTHPARALLDSGSQSNIMSERLCQLLKLKRRNVNIPIHGVGEASASVKHCVHSCIRSRKNNFEMDIDFLVLPRITIDLPAVTFPTSNWHIPPDLFLADPSFNQTGTIDLLLGAEHFFTFVNPGTRVEKDQKHILVDSVFGWIVAGRNQMLSSTVSRDVTSCNIFLSDTLQDSVERFWKIEEISNKPSLSVDEQQCETHYITHVSRTHDGRYKVRLPRHADIETMLGDSKAVALRQYLSLEKRLDRDPQLKQEYHNFLSEYLSLGHMRIVPRYEPEPAQAFYIPHHPILKASSTTTKLRVVFNGSVHSSTGYSLNDALLVGPVVQDDLLNLIIRFRKYPIALVADIEKMYRQILVDPADVSLQRIFWRFAATDPIEICELLTVTYGLASSSFLATRTLNQLCQDEGKNYSLGGPALMKQFYVDDYIGGAQTVEEAIQTRKELDELLTKGGFKLRKWSSSNPLVLEDLETNRIETQNFLKLSPEEPIKALGVNWEPNTDQLRFDCNVIATTCHPTKRSILSDISKHFDPLGLTAPVVIRAKMLLQELWLQPCRWDEKVSDSINNKWKVYCSELPKLSSYSVNRCIFLSNSTVQLHTFADASEQAYGACTYARSSLPNGQVHVRLISAKSRVAPLKRLSIPRLELSAAVLAAQLHAKISEALDMPISSSYFWSDSTVTLQWLRSPPHVWKTFIANRVSEIQSTTQGSQWNHVAGSHNPADLITRGMKVDDFLESDLWHNGPLWLHLPQEKWPKSTSEVQPPNEVMERRVAVAAVQTTTVVNEQFHRTSSYQRLLRVTAYCLRFISACKQRESSKRPRRSNILTVDELSQARVKLVNMAQKDSFAEEIKDLKAGKSVSKRSSLRLLSPFLDPDGILRVGGRLKLSDQPYLTKHPILLPSYHPFTRSIATDFHVKLLHGGGRVTLATMRQEYWPINGRRLISSIMRNCFRCTRASPTPATQQTGQLPYHRITPSRPFTVTGVDYAGPIYLKPPHKRAANIKAYISIFVCFATKAVHIELVSNLSTAAFLAALRRFIARRGRPSQIYSDNGKNFEGARNELQEIHRLLQREESSGEIYTFCATEGILWKMIPPRAPHFGGLWEAAVKTAKKHLHRQLGNIALTFEDMCTILTQIEACMNSRPLTPMTENPDDLAILTPSHFLIGTSISALPEFNVTMVPLNRLDHYQRLQERVQTFWHHWRTDYLQALQKEAKLTMPNHEIRVGKMVIVVDEFLPPVRWPLARITEAHPGKDGLIRVVTLRTLKGSIRRPISKVCLLPNQENNEI